MKMLLFIVGTMFYSNTRAFSARIAHPLLRLSLAALIGFWTPFVQAAEPSFDALSHLLHAYAGPVDEQAAEAAAEDTPPESGARLAKIQSDLSLLAEGFEAFRHPSHARHALKDLPDHLVPELRPFFKDRDSTLDTVYRTLAVTDYTWALRFPEPNCDPLQRRRILLSSKDELFTDPKSGELSSWLARLLGPAAHGRTAEEALDRASSKQALSASDYELLRVKVARITEALTSDKAVGKERSKLYCLRADAYETLASAHRAAQDEPIQASRGAAATDLNGKEAGSVLLLALEEGPGRFRAVGAGVMVETPQGPKVLTDARLMPAEGEDKPSLRAFARAKDGTLNRPRVFVAERVDHASGVMVGRLQGEGDIPALKIAQSPAARRDLFRAIGHMSASGAWTISQGLVTETGEGTFSSDAILGPDMLGSPLLNDAGEVVGLVVLSPGAGAPVAVQTEHLRRVVDGALPPAKDLEFLASRQSGSASLLTTAMPLIGELRAPGGGAIEAGLPNSLGGVNWSGGGGVGNWRPRSSAGPPSGYSRSYSAPSSSYGSGKSAGTEIGEALAPLVEALIFKGIPALFRGIGSMFKSKPSANAPAPRREAVQSRPREIEKPKEPPKLTGLTLTITPDEGLEGETLTATAELSFSGDEPKKDGINVVFTDNAKGKIVFPNNQPSYSAPTNAFGKVTITFELSAKERDLQLPFDELKDEERRRVGAETPSRVRPDRKPKNAFEKVKQRAPDAFDSLDNEEQRTQTEELSADQTAAPETETTAVSEPTNAAVLVGPTPGPHIVPLMDTPVTQSLIATFKMTASASSGAMGSAKGDGEVKVVSGECPPGTIAADPSDSGQPGHPPMGSPHKALLEEKCLPFEQEAEKACGKDRACRDAKLLDLGYDFRACVNRWEMDGSGGAGSIGSPPLPKPNKRLRCVRKSRSVGQAKTRELTLYTQKPGHAGDGSDEDVVPAGGVHKEILAPWLEKLTGIVRLLFTRDKMQHEFKHAGDFGVSGTGTNQALNAYQKAIIAHIKSVSKPIRGTYRGNPVFHFFDAKTGKNVMVDTHGNFVGGWRLSDRQVFHVTSSGNLGGGP